MGYPKQTNVFEEYIELTKQTGIYPEDQALTYLALGLTSEAGEVAGKIKKSIRDGVLNETELILELGDVFWYLVSLCRELNINPSYVIQKNTEKLLKRKANGTLKGEGDNR